MGYIRFFCGGTTRATVTAERILKDSGICFGSEPGRDITDLLLDVPSFNGDGSLRDGEEPEALLSRLSPNTRVWGGNLPALDFPGIDLLKDQRYLLENAAITADCALKIAAPVLPSTWASSRVLVIGWGRIGKNLAKMLKLLGAKVTVAARKVSDRALLRAMGYEALDTGILCYVPCSWDVIFNTVPAPVLGPEQLDSQKNCIAIDLASKPGLQGRDVITARGLPGKLAPSASGKLIAGTVLRLGKGLL